MHPSHLLRLRKTRLIKLALAASLGMGLLSPFAFAQKAPNLPVLTPQTHVSAQVEQLDAFKNYQLRQPDGSVTILPGVDRFETADFNFDGLQDLRVIRMRGVNTIDQLYLYNPLEKRYALLAITPALQSQLLCDGLMNIRTVKPRNAAPLLANSCSTPRGGHISFDYLQWNAQGQLQLIRQYASAPLEIAQPLQPYTDLPWGASQKLSVYAADGTITTRQRTSRALEPVVFKALSTHTQMVLRQTASADTPTVFTLPQGQVCDLLDINGNWMELSCKNNQGQLQQGWLDWADVLANQPATSPKPFIVTEASLLKQY